MQKILNRLSSKGLMGNVAYMICSYRRVPAVSKIKQSLCEYDTYIMVAFFNENRNVKSYLFDLDIT